MKTSSKAYLSTLLRNRFDSLIMSWEYLERDEIIKVAEDFNPELAEEMKQDNKA